MVNSYLDTGIAILYININAMAVCHNDITAEGHLDSRLFVVTANHHQVFICSQSCSHSLRVVIPGRAGSADDNVVGDVLSSKTQYRNIATTVSGHIKLPRTHD